jgi:triosephosphate isomerase
VLIAGNWKMFRGPDPAALVGLDAVICPPYTRLRDCVEAGLTTFAQNVHWEWEGAYTGEIAAPLLLELGVVGSLVGHSERRQYFGETDETVAKRVRAALDAGLRVIACVGETQHEREGGETEEVLRRQLAVLEPHPELVLAYEPVWAIGTGRTATPEMAQEAHAFIKSQLDAPVLYGGSVKPDNAAALL